MGAALGNQNRTLKIDRESIGCRYLSGESGSSIAESLSISAHAVYDELHRQGLTVSQRRGAMVPCDTCGEPIYRQRHILEKQDMYYCSRKCKGQAPRSDHPRKINASVMDAAINDYLNEKSTVGIIAKRYAIGSTTLNRHLHRRGIAIPYRVVKTCKYCDQQYVATGAKQEACDAPKCQSIMDDRRRLSKNVWNQRHLVNQKRRATMRSAFDEEIDRLVVAELFDWICQECDDDINPYETHKLADGSLNPEYLHIDHIVSLSNGGRHHYSNVQPTHAWCNWSKNNTD